jgi:GMP synthase (glutamine-hydrolysing)
MTSIAHDRLLIIDFGSQVTQLIARRLRELHVYCEIHPYQKVTDAFLADFAPKAIIFSGGPDSVTREGSPRPPQSAYAMGVPILGICYGQQAMMQDLGGLVEGGKITGGGGTAEFGRAWVTPAGPLDLLEGWFATGREQVWMSHGDHVSRLAPGFEVYGTSPNAPFAITADPARHFYAVQFHPEVHHTPMGARLYENFVRLAGFKGDWTMGAYKDEAIAKIRAQVGDGRVICGLSGGVDSSVAAVLIHEAIGDQLTCVFVDHGLMRQNEADEVVTMFRDHYNIPLIHADEGDLFLGALEGVSDPEVKRKTIGRLFIDVFQTHATAVGGAEFLAQGTLYPDVIESVSFSGGPSVTIKSHHNVGGLPEKMGLKLVEPLRELFKDEVRALGTRVGPARPLHRPPPLPRPRPRHPLPRRDHAREAGNPAPRRRRLHRPDPPPRALRRDLAGLRGPPARAHRGRDGRRAHLRLRLRAPRGHERRRDDGRLLPLLPRLPRRDRHADHQRGAGHQPGHLRHHLEAAGDDRMGMTRTTTGPRAR